MAEPVLSTGPSAHEVLDALLDPGTQLSWDRRIDLAAVPPDYRRELERAARHAAADEAVVTREGAVNGRRVAVIVSEFSFLAGSIGRGAAKRIVDAFQRATAERLPVIASVASGGTRMQEGTPAFLMMTDVARAIGEHRAAGLPYLVHLRHPTTGGALASWGSLGQVTLAEPGALVGFLGPKVFEALHGHPFPPGTQTAENLVRQGVVDAVVGWRDLRRVVDLFLAATVDPAGTGRHRRRPTPPLAASTLVWDSIARTRRFDRCGALDLLRYGSFSTLRLSGTHEGEEDSSIVVALARMDDAPCVLVAQDRTAQSGGSPMGPAALRQARRGMRLAGELRLPLVTVIDTPGAELSTRAESGAIAGEVARCLMTLTSLRVPTLSVLLGQGCGGGALALLPADVVIACENAWLSPLPLEGASFLLHGDTDHAASVAAAQEVSASQLYESGFVTALVAESNISGADPAASLARAVTAEIGHHLRSLAR